MISFVSGQGLKAELEVKRSSTILQESNIEETNAEVTMSKDTKADADVANREDDATSERLMKGDAIKTSPSQQSVDPDQIEFSVDLILKMEEIIDSNKDVYRGSFSSKQLGPSEEQKVAVKVLGKGFDHEMARKYADKFRKAEMCKKIWREIENLRVLIHHPNVVRYIHSFTDDKQSAEPRICYLVMELCDPVTLKGRLENLDEYKELRDNEYRKAVILHITQGLRYIHLHSICHRDIKPSNILFSSDKQVVKISDFGLSKPIIRESGEHSSTPSTGTDNYRAPETFKEGHVGSYRSDIFSIGIVYFNVLSEGKHPFGENCKDQTANIMKEICKPSLTGLNGPDAALAKDIIQKMLHYNPDERPNTADILKHPYFWTVDNIVGFYVRVADYLDADRSNSGSTSSSAVSIPKKKAFNDFSNKCSVTSSHKDTGSNCLLGLDFAVCNDITTLKMKEELTAAEESLCDEIRQGKSIENIILKFETLCEICVGSSKVRADQSHSARSLYPREISAGSDRKALLSNINKFDNLQRSNKDLNSNIVEINTKLWNLKSSKNGRTDEEVKKAYKDIESLVSKLVKDVKHGDHMSWIKCLEKERDRHNRQCEDCEHYEFLFEFFEKQKSPTPDLFQFVKYVRNKLVHLEDDKINKVKTEGKVKKKVNWMRHHREILNFVVSILPELLPHLFRVMREPLANYIEENKQQDSSFFLPDIRRHWSSS